MKSTKLEIGCGLKKPWRKEFVGLDRFPLEGVDVVFDLDRGAPLPFEDNSFELIYASHCLEHVQDLISVMKELWRISKPGGQLCILAPYDHTALNAANPYHLQTFNEHTPRFWTTAPTSNVPKNEYWFSGPSQPIWGLSDSDNSLQDMDWRCMGIEFFYFSAFAHLTKRKKRRLRRSQRDVCHSLLYHLTAFKHPMAESKIELLPKDFYIPNEVHSLRFACNEGPLKSTLRRIAHAVLGSSPSKSTNNTPSKPNP